MSTNKKVIKIDVIKRLSELFPKMTIVDLLDYIELCESISKELTPND